MRAAAVALVLAVLLAGCMRDQPVEAPVGLGGAIAGWRVHVESLVATPILVTHSAVTAGWTVAACVILANDSAGAPLRIELLGNESEILANKTYAHPLPPGEIDRACVGFGDMHRSASVEQVHAVRAISGGDSVTIDVRGRGAHEPPTRTLAPLPAGATFALGPWDVQYRGAAWRHDAASWQEVITLDLQATPREDASGLEGAKLRAHLGAWSGVGNTSAWPSEPGTTRSVMASMWLATYGGHSPPYLAMLAWGDEAVVLEIPPPAKK